MAPPQRKFAGKGIVILLVWWWGFCCLDRLSRECLVVFYYNIVRGPLGYFVDRCGQTTSEVTERKLPQWSHRGEVTGGINEMSTGHLCLADAITFLITPYEIPVTLLAWLIETPAIHIS